MSQQSSPVTGYIQSGSLSQGLIHPDSFILGPPLKAGTVYKVSEDGGTLTPHAKLLDKNALGDDRYHPCSIELLPDEGIDDERTLVQIPDGLVIAIPDELCRLLRNAFKKDRLSDRELSGSRRLSEMAVQAGAIGFWIRRPFRYQFLEPQASIWFHGLKGEMFGRSDAEIRDVATLLRARLDRILGYAGSYAGWLMSNPQFRSEHLHLLKEFRNEVVSIGFPTRRMLSRDGNPGIPKFHERCLSHYQRWILDGVEGPDLPVPVAAQFPNHMHPETSSGVSSHLIPAYLPVSGQGWFSDMLDDSRPTQRQMPHLAEWFEIVRKENASLNKMEAYRRRMRLLHYWRGLVLAFPDLLHRSKTKLTEVFASFLKVGDDTIRGDLRVLNPVFSEGWLLPP